MPRTAVSRGWPWPALTVSRRQTTRPADGLGRLRVGRVLLVEDGALRDADRAGRAAGAGAAGGGRAAADALVELRVLRGRPVAAPAATGAWATMASGVSRRNQATTAMAATTRARTDSEHHRASAPRLAAGTATRLSMRGRAPSAVAAWTGTGSGSTAVSREVLRTGLGRLVGLRGRQFGRLGTRSRPDADRRRSDAGCRLRPGARRTVAVFDPGDGCRRGDALSRPMSASDSGGSRERSCSSSAVRARS